MSFGPWNILGMSVVFAIWSAVGCNAEPRYFDDFYTPPGRESAPGIDAIEVTDGRCELLDMLFVVDDSTDGQYLPAQLANVADDIVARLDALDSVESWRIGVTTTSVSREFSHQNGFG